MTVQSKFAFTLFAFLLVHATPSAADPQIIKVPAVAPAAQGPIEVTANYDISLNGFSLGSLDFNATAQGGTYIASSDVQISALLGAFKWRGVTRTAGSLSGSNHVPQSYSFQFAGTGRSGDVRLGFSGDEVTTLTVNPQQEPVADLVPLERRHLKGALDPLSTILAMTRAKGESPCASSFKLFDGKQRFDLALSHRRNEPVELAGGVRDTLIVCKVKYTPVAGYRANAETQALAASNGIEIAFRKLPAAGLVLPYRVVVPTIAGDAVLQAQHVNVSRAGRREVANVE